MEESYLEISALHSSALTRRYMQTKSGQIYRKMAKKNDKFFKSGQIYMKNMECAEACFKRASDVYLNTHVSNYKYRCMY